MPNLTAKQEAFCKQIALQGMNQSEAYRSAYNTKNMSDKTVNNNAYILTQNSEITARIEELKATLTEKAIEKALYTREESFNYLKDIQSRAKQNDKFNDELKAEELKGKLNDLYIDTSKLIGDKDKPIETKMTITFVKPK